MKNKIINSVLWLSYLLAMAASLGHVAATFNRFERTGAQYVGWIAAVSVDAGLAALAYAVQQRRRAKRPSGALWLGVAFFASISAYANVLHALSVSPDTMFSAIVFSATLPILVIYMGEIVSSDDVAVAEQAQAEFDRQKARAEREERKAKLELERLEQERAREKQAALEAEQAKAEAEQEQARAELAKAETERAERLMAVAFKCPVCDYAAPSQKALNGHRLKHVGKVRPVNGNGHIIAAPAESAHET